jgi:hypothetical protein
MDQANNPPPPPPPSPPTTEENKQTAVYLLQETDWTTIPDVSDPTKSNPYLSNVNNFVTYRNAVRQYAINPVAGRHYLANIASRSVDYGIRGEFEGNNYVDNNYLLIDNFISLKKKLKSYINIL